MNNLLNDLFYDQLNNNYIKKSTHKEKLKSPFSDPYREWVATFTMRVVSRNKQGNCKLESVESMKNENFHVCLRNIDGEEKILATMRFQVCVKTNTMDKVEKERDLHIDNLRRSFLINNYDFTILEKNHLKCTNSKGMRLRIHKHFYMRYSTSGKPVYIKKDRLDDIQRIFSNIQTDGRLSCLAKHMDGITDVQIGVDFMKYWILFNRLYCDKTHASEWKLISDY